MEESRCLLGRGDVFRLLCEGRRNTGDLGRKSKVPKPQMMDFIGDGDELPGTVS